MHRSTVGVEGAAAGVPLHETQKSVVQYLDSEELCFSLSPATRRRIDKASIHIRHQEESSTREESPKTCPPGVSQMELGFLEKLVPALHTVHNWVNLAEWIDTSDTWDGDMVPGTSMTALATNATPSMSVPSTPALASHNKLPHSPSISMMQPNSSKVSAGPPLSSMPSSSCSEKDRRMVNGLQSAAKQSDELLAADMFDSEREILAPLDPIDDCFMLSMAPQNLNSMEYSNTVCARGDASGSESSGLSDGEQLEDQQLDVKAQSLGSLPESAPAPKQVSKASKNGQKQRLQAEPKRSQGDSSVELKKAEAIQAKAAIVVPNGTQTKTKQTVECTDAPICGNCEVASPGSKRSRYQYTSPKDESTPPPFKYSKNGLFRVTPSARCARCALKKKKCVRVSDNICEACQKHAQKVIGQPAEYQKRVCACVIPLVYSQKGISVAKEAGTHHQNGSGYCPSTTSNTLITQIMVRNGLGVPVKRVKKNAGAVTGPADTKTLKPADGISRSNDKAMPGRSGSSLATTKAKSVKSDSQDSFEDCLVSSFPPSFAPESF